LDLRGWLWAWEDGAMESWIIAIVVTAAVFGAFSGIHFLISRRKPGEMVSRLYFGLSFGCTMLLFKTVIWPWIRMR
jgi:hypothetical protein